MDRTALHGPSLTWCRALVWVLIIACVWTPTALGQTAPGPPDVRPTYQPYRYDEDWSVLRDPALRRDVWDGVKYVPLERDDWYLSVGGEARWRYEHVRRPEFGAQPDDRSGYVLQRYLLHTDWHLGTRVRAFVEVQSGLEAGRLGGPRPTDENTLDLHQGFLDITWHRSDRGSLTTRLGRHEVAFGAGRLISAAEGRNVRRSFEGARLILERGAWTWNSTAMRLVTPARGAFDDRADPELIAWGAGASGPRPGRGSGNLAIYYIGVRRTAARFDQGTADTVRHSGGVRLWGTVGPLDYDQDLIVQRGRSGDAVIRAYAAASDLGFAPRHTPGRPRLGVRVFAASGDHNPVEPELNAFDPLFPSIAYSGRAGLVGPTNLVTVGPSASFTPHPRVRLAFDWAPFWRTSTRDGLYGINVAVLRTGQRSTERFVGSQATAETDVRLTTHLSLSASLVLFRAGPFLRETPPGLDSRYLATHIAYRF